MDFGFVRSRPMSASPAVSEPLRRIKPKTRLTPKLYFSRKYWFVTISFVVLAIVGYEYWPRSGMPSRVVNTTVQFPLSPPSENGWTTENAFPHLKFFEPTCVVVLPDGSNRIFVLERHGAIQCFDNHRESRKKLQLLDISNQVIRTPYDDDGALGLALHPDFGKPGSPNASYLYVFYTADVDGKCYDRLSRFTTSSNGSKIDPQSELVLIDQYDENLWHNGGALTFGPDGFLYVGVGDEGTNGDGLKNGQRIDRDLFCGILRIDVDRIGGKVSHAPVRQPETGTTANYFIPNDNPFVGVSGALEEFWSTGLRNPHRMSFDPDTKKLWIGDVGHLYREEINIATRGSNHGWSYIEGRLPFHESYLKGQKPSPFYGAETLPVFDYAHLNGNNCVIGGFVYRGAEYPELFGKYIYADNGSGRIWALSYDGEKVVSNAELTALPVSSKTGISSITESSDGEPWIIVLGEADQVDGTIHRLIPGEPGSGSQLPKLLSQTGIFSNLDTLQPNPGVYPYDVNVPLWSDGAKKKRWVILPGDGTDPDPATDRIEFTSTGEWRFPSGSIFVKHFELPIDETDPSALQRVETRVLVRDAVDGVYGFTYKWNEDQTDAELLDDELLETISIKTASGMRTQTWQFPSRQTCLFCHTQKAGGVLGVSARQINCELTYTESDVTANQLLEWNRVGMFTEQLDEQELIESPQLVDLDEEHADLETRVRSYLDVNCGACHRPGGVRANFDARFDTPLARQNLIGGTTNTASNIPGATVVKPGDPSHSMLVYRMLHGEKRMPDIGVMRRDLAAITALCEWIDSLTPKESIPKGATQ